MSLRQKLVEVCHKVYMNGFVTAYDGNISAITENNTFLITRSGVCKGDVTDNDILEIDAAGNILSGKGKLSTEFKVHLFAYSRRREVNAVVHCHPVYATAFTLTGEGLSRHYFPEVILTLGKVPLCTYATPSTEELPMSMEPYIDHAWAFLFQNHGAVTLGKNLDDAYYKMEKLEQAAKTLYIAKTIGKVTELSYEDVKFLFKIAKDVYGLDPDERNIF